MLRQWGVMTETLAFSYFTMPGPCSYLNHSEKHNSAAQMYRPLVSLRPHGTGSRSEGKACGWDTGNRRGWGRVCWCPAVLMIFVGGLGTLPAGAK